MGDYTKFVFDAQINPAKATVIEFFDKVDYVCDIRTIEPTPDHEFFTKPRWHMLFRGTSVGYATSGTHYYEGDDLYPFTVHINSSFKNYSGEIVSFLDWANDWAIPDYIHGYALDEYGPPKWITNPMQQGMQLVERL